MITRGNPPVGLTFKSWARYFKRERRECVSTPQHTGNQVRGTTKRSAAGFTVCQRLRRVCEGYVLKAFTRTQTRVSGPLNSWDVRLHNSWFQVWGTGFTRSQDGLTVENPCSWRASKGLANPSHPLNGIALGIPEPLLRLQCFYWLKQSRLICAASLCWRQVNAIALTRQKWENIDRALIKAYSISKKGEAVFVVQPTVVTYCEPVWICIKTIVLAT